MREALASLLDFNGPALLLIAVRLVLAVVLGLGIAAVYRRARTMNEEAESFTVTLQNPSAGAFLGVITSATVTIVD